MREAFRVRKGDFFNLINSGMLVEIVFLFNGELKFPHKKNQFAPINQALRDLSSVINFICPR